MNDRTPSNPWLCVVIVLMIGLCSVFCVIGIVACVVLGRAAPPELIALAASGIGSLASILVSVPRGSVGYPDDRKESPK